VPFTWIRAEIKNTPWNASTVYNNGDLVAFGASNWQASWWTQNQQPGDPYGPWQEMVSDADGTIVWTASRTFVGGEVVVYGGRHYQAKWWTRNQAPGDQYGPWQALD
jgi:chitodextrinase